VVNWVSLRLKGKVAIVTGAGQGIGKAIAIAFAREGAIVAALDCNELSVSATAEAIRQSGGTAISFTADVTDQASLAQCVEQTLARFGRVDVLAANAGVNVFHQPLETSEEEWKRCFAVNVDGMWNSARAVLPQMGKQGSGSIVMMASVHSFQVIPGSFPYGVSKHAVVGLIRALAVEYGPRGVRVNGIAPSYVETEAVAAYWQSFPDPAAERERAASLHPYRHIGQPEEVAMTAVFLASDEAPFINAAIIPMDGGRSVLYHD
jgi:NAD(P)-dependent dehydrogenase (short-subunit alcohol dehydrogenase family)